VTNHKHDNRSAFQEGFLRPYPSGVTNAIAALADALGVELHPAGTAARLSAERSQLLPPRRLRVPPVYRDTPTDVLECLYHTLCRRTYPSEVRNKASDIMYERDLMDHYTGDLTDDGWGDLTAIEHPEGREHVEPDEHEKPAAPHPTWSEPTEQMSPERCYHVARALGFHVDVRSTFDGADRTYWAFISEWNGLDQDDGPRMATELEAWQSAVVMAARKRDKLVIGVGDRVDLTGLEVLP